MTKKLLVIGNEQQILDMTPEEEAQKAADEAATVARAQAEAQANADAAALRQQIITIAQSAVGVRVDQLTAIQVRALFAIRLNKDDAIAGDLTIRPLADWVR